MRTERAILTGAVAGLEREHAEHRRRASELNQQLLAGITLPRPVRKRLARAYHVEMRQAKACLIAAELLQSELAS